MDIVTQAMLDQYLKDDWMLKALEPRDDHFTIQRWLKETPAKRMIFAKLYGDLLEGRRRSVLDVGGGFSSLTRTLAAAQEYELLELCAHDTADAIHKIEVEIGKTFFTQGEWSEFLPQRAYDVIIANDLFPNVDQRLTLFLRKMLPFAREIRLSLTFYNTPRAYQTRRIDADEIFTLQAYDGAHTALALQPFAQAIGEQALSALASATASIYPNGRQVALLTLKGNA